ncbi:MULTISPECIES: type II secretion system F family protein [unclassified Massilia]|uniref:type II secretion system F family protein n=1 Tax=unclassified Massilia TaxID=2609279 RepID=UPI00177E089D|nr:MULTISPECIES: type II secretion system F family protein [unclassified Massilia]MBD8530942.1 type II secretion system F family protein [Massilia sp. CFBP 13647]MBD8674645.1 type II secretion system F family protein [Massilia sp. CFBP 13721]
MDLTFVLFVLLLFVAILLLVWGVYVGWQAHRSPEAERIARRLRGVIGGEARQSDVTIVKQRRFSDDAELDTLLRRLPGTYRLDRMLQQAGSQQLVAALVGFCLTGFVLGLLLALWLGMPWLGVLVAAGGGASLPLLRLARARATRMARFERQLPDALDMMSRAMRAGHAFPTALKLVADEISAPLGEEFKAAFDEVNFGVAMADALGNLAQRVPSMDLQYFVVAVLIQRESGGNLTELLSSIAGIIRDRHKLAGQVRVLSAEGRISAWVLCLLPFGAGAMMYLANPETMGVLWTDPGGRKMLYTALGMMLFGVLAIRKIVRIRM